MSDESVFANYLAQQLQNIQQLIEMLHAEKNTLQQHVPSELVDISEKKSTLLAAIDTLDKECKALPDYQAYIISEQYSERLTDIKELLTECQKLNSINGTIIGHSSLAIERMQNKLLENRNRSSITYTNKGKKQGSTLGRSFKA